MFSPVSQDSSPTLQMRFGRADHVGIDLDVPVLAGAWSEMLFPEARPAGSAGAFSLFRDGDWLLGGAHVAVADDPEAATHALYRDLLGATQGHALARVWHFVPAINEPSSGGLENYRAFCRGRSLAFEEAFGPEFPRHAPAASAVGARGDRLAIAFAAHRGTANHVENPRQIPAYEYPPEHGPRAPTFSRASLVDLGGGQRAVFVSGTSAIRGHASVAPGDTARQLACTLDNLREIALACGLGPDVGATRVRPRHIKVYLRRRDDLDLAREMLDSVLVCATDAVSYVQADICRRELNVEIEVSLPALPAG